MRMVLTKWSSFVGRPDPSVPVEEDLAESEATPVVASASSEDNNEDIGQGEDLDALEWEPIPDVTNKRTDDLTDGHIGGNAETHKATWPFKNSN
jgi:hypothetical protein